MSSGSRGDAEDLFAEASKAVDLLYNIRTQERKTPMQRATYEYLRGKVLDVFPEYKKEAEDHLSKAVKLNPSLADAWLSLDNLGNACLTSFFATGAWDHGKLLQSLKAYQHAEKDERMSSNPDLYYNSAIVNKYLENYERALSGFEAAALRDPGLNAMEEVHKIVRLLDKIESLLRRRDNLLEGLNKAVAIVGRVIFFVKHENVAPFFYLLCDSSQICYVLSVYGIQSEAIKEGDQLTLLDPSYHYVDFSWKGKLYQFRSVRIDFLEQVLVNGKTLSPQHSVQTSIYAQKRHEKNKGGRPTAAPWAPYQITVDSREYD
ncbi:UNVERIFIED_CONTAM: Tetratricopeptide repeat protein 5 [Sesamum calycinum]|uniref:Tetratricopeptide repeat protein 5 n=1 Tax=Sesamum calycinum TaxID=2727403 RepID=A0AAW2SW07_9LAMI